MLEHEMTNRKTGIHDEGTALRSIVEGTATETGERFFASLVESLAKALNTHAAWVTEYIPESRRLRAHALWMGGQFVPNYETKIDGTPCQRVIEEETLVHYPDRVVELYPDDPDVKRNGAVSYLGVPLKDLDDTILGHLAVMDRRPMPEDAHALALFQIFAARAGAELRRLRAERELREREEKLARLVDSAMDAIIELDENMHLTRINPAAEKVCGCTANAIVGQPFDQFLTDDSRAKLTTLIAELDARPSGTQYLWIPGGLTVRRSNGETFAAEATLSRFDMHRRTYHTLILRDVNDRLEAERRIQSLTREAEYLREEIREFANFGEILGNSAPLRRLLHEVNQVAAADTTVLILGETGSGKELIARAIHGASPRQGKPLVKVNCAAIPASLIESEFFGHERGAFTGATGKREGRFALADGGTIFLDEVGELPLELQGKLLRVLQEGEFEPVGSSRTRKVNVRVVAATNRDLYREVQDGRFREDLYYRLSVFPLTVPPLRERGDDIALLAEAFARKFAQKTGRTLAPFTPQCLARLKAYPWPGNVRELQNVIERAVITARDGRMNLDRALPDIPEINTLPAAPEDSSDRIRTVQEIEALERANILRALETCGWRVSGDNGAAVRLGMNPSTLSSRIKTLGIRRPN